MDDIVSTRPVRSKAIGAAAMERRRQALRQADASNRIEGLFRSPESAPIFEAFIHGDIELDEVLQHLKALHHHL